MIYSSRGLLGRIEVGREDLVLWCFVGVFLTLPTGTSPPTIFGVLGAFIWLVSGLAFRVGSFIRQSWFWPVSAFIALPWIGLLYSVDAGGFGIDYAGKTYYWIFCLALASLPLKSPQSRLMIDAFLVGLALNACVGLLQLAGVLAPKQELFSGLIRGYSALAVYLVLGILISAFYFREAKERKRRAVIMLAMVIYFCHLMIIESRAGHLTFIVLLPFILRTVFREIKAWKLILLCLVIIGAMFSSPTVRKRIDQTFRELNYHLTAESSKAWGREYTDRQDRFYMWVGAVRLFLDKPILGYGTGGYPEALKSAGSHDEPLIAHPHNNILHMATSYGVIGILAFVWFFATVLRNGWRGRHSAAGHLVFSTALVLLIDGIFNTTILDGGTLILLSTVAGLQPTLVKLDKVRESVP